MGVCWENLGSVENCVTKLQYSAGVRYGPQIDLMGSKDFLCKCMEFHCLNEMSVSTPETKVTVHKEYKSALPQIMVHSHAHGLPNHNTSGVHAFRPPKLRLRTMDTANIDTIAVEVLCLLTANKHVQDREFDCQQFSHFLINIEF